MNDTMQVDAAMHGFGSRPKRIKTEHSRGGDNGFVEMASRFPLGSERPPPLQINGSFHGIPRAPEPAPGIKETPGLYSNIPGPAIPHGTPGPGLTTPNAPPAPPPPLYVPPSSHQAALHALNPPQPDLSPSRQPRPPVTGQHIEHLPPPKNPTELVWWVASNFSRQSSSPQNGQNTMDVNQLLSNPTTPQSASAIPQVSYHEADATAEKNRLRQENRVRKQRWRQDNAERNKDNDLRCRVNKIAKQKYGSEETAEKAQFIEHEFSIRRQKREQKQRNRAQQSGTLPTFSSTSGLNAGDIRSNFSGPAAATAFERAMRILRLLGNHPMEQPLLPPVLDEAQGLIEDIDKGNISLEALNEAARSSASDHFRIAPVYQSPHGSKESERGSSSGDDEAHNPAQFQFSSGESSNAGIPLRPQPSYPFSSSLLTDLGGDRSYASPYSNPGGEKGSPTPLTTEVSKGTNQGSEPLTTSEADPSDMNLATPDRIDALIDLADVSDDENDETGDDKGMDPALTQSKTKRTRSRKSNGKNSRHARSTERNGVAKAKTGRVSGSNGTDASVKKRTSGSAPNQVFSNSAIAVNTIVPVAQAQAASKMAPIDRPVPRGKSVRAFQSGETSEDEQKKVRRYGFPPLPGAS